MAISILNLDVVNGIGTGFMKAASIPSDFTPVLDELTDSSDQAPVFDTKHEVYTNPLVDAQSQNDIGNNKAGLEPTLTLEPSLSYTYSDGYSTEHEESKGFSIGVTQAFSYEFAGVGGETTLSATGTFNWSDSTGEDQTTTKSSGLTAIFTIPAGKIYEIKLLFNQETLTVPYTWATHLEGAMSFKGPGGVITNEFAIGDVFSEASKAGTLPTVSGVEWKDFAEASSTQIDYILSGNLTIQGAGQSYTQIYDVTNGDSQAVQAEYDPEVPVGVHRFMDDAGRSFRDTPFADYVDGGAGDDRIWLRAGGDIAHGHGGNDVIRAEGVGRGLLDGGAGDDVIRLLSATPGGTLVGGEGDDRIFAYGPASLVYGGAGDDRIWLLEESAGGTVITDAEGRNRLRIGTDGPVGFERVEGSDNLYILLGGGETYDRARDVVWVDFFENPNNRVDGLRTAEVAELAATFDPTPPLPAALTPSVPEFINAANWTYSRDEGNLPAGLRPLEVDGEHLTREVTEDGFYGAAFLTPSDQVIVAFEGTHLSGLDERPEFVLAQIAADVQLYLGRFPEALDDAFSFTLDALEAAQAQGIASEDVFVTGHSLGGAEAQYVASLLGLAGQTFGGPGLRATGVVPPADPSQLANFVEYGDPVGKYSADPNYLGGFLYSDEILRFGEATYIGDPLARLGLEAAGALFGPGTTPQQNLQGLGLLVGLAAEYHPLASYAEDLGVTLDDPDAYGGTEPDPAGLLAAARALLAGAGVAEPVVA